MESATRPWPRSKDETVEEFHTRTAGKIRWDRESAAAAPAPLPFHADEGLLLAWGSPPREPGARALASPLAGALVDSPADPPHLLATSTDEDDGELDTQLLRAPVPGVFRFERYHHVVRTPAGGLALRRPSASGRITLRTTPLRLLKGLDSAFDEAETEIDDPLRVVFEHIRPEVLLEVLPPLLMDQVRRFRPLVDSAVLRKDDGGLGKGLRDTVGWLLRTWQAVAILASHLTTVPASVASALSTHVPLGTAPDDDNLEAAAVAVTGDASALSALTTFVTDIFARLVLGESWTDDGLSVDPGSAHGGSDAEKEVIEFARVYERWLPCFAGTPLGKAGLVWVLDDARTEVWEEWDEASGTGGRFLDVAKARRNLFTTFDVEALYQARVDDNGETTTDHGAARSEGLIGERDIIDFGDHSLHGGRLGWVAVLRLVEDRPPDRRLTTLDWQREIVCGAVRRRYQEPLLDFARLAASGHPLSEMVEWERYQRARALRDRMDGLLAANVSGTPLEQHSVEWWRDQTNLADAAGQWPSGFSAARSDPTPRHPYMAAGTATSGRDRAVTRGRRQVRLAAGPFGAGGALGVATHTLWDFDGGWDDFDLLAILAAAAVVKDGRTLKQGVQPALVAAVTDVEGYRVFMGQDRIPSSFFDFCFVGGLPHPSLQAGGSRQADFVATHARQMWQLWTLGLDLLNRPRKGRSITESWDRPSLSLSTFPDDADAYVDWVVARLTRLDWNDHPGEPIPSGDPAAATSLLDLDWLAAGDVNRFVKTRLGGRWTTFGDPPPIPAGTPTVRFSRLSRRLQYVGLALQAAIFQWVHRQVHLQTGYLPDEFYDAVSELVDPARPPPDPGPGATDVARRDYIAYWSLVYLAFNASPGNRTATGPPPVETAGIWNRWVRAAEARRSATQPVSYFTLFELDNSALNTTTASSAERAALGALGAMTRFAATLDAYLRLDWALDPGSPGPTDIDATDPDSRAWDQP